MEGWPNLYHRSDIIELERCDVQLTEPEVKDFFRLINGLMLYTNGQLGIHPKIQDVKKLVAAGAGPQADLCKAFYDDTSIIERYAGANPDGLSAEDLATVRSWRFFVRGKFLVYRYTEDYTTFIYMECGDPPKAYAVLSLNTPLGMMLGPNLPVMVEATLLPFRSRIIHDGIISTYSVCFGKGFASLADKWFEQAGVPITDLFGEMPSGSREEGRTAPAAVSETPISVERCDADDYLDQETLDKLTGPARDALNRDPMDDFEGLSPKEMHGLLYSPFDTERSPMDLSKEIPPDLLEGAAFPRDMTRFLEMVKEEGPMKLTATGALPRAFCRRLCEEGLVEHDREWFRKNPIMREDESYYINLLDMFSREFGLTKRRGPHISLTRAGHGLLKASPSERVGALFRTYVEKYSWRYEDGYPPSSIIQAGFGFSLYLLSMHGKSPRDGGFYSSAFLRAFPMALEDFHAETYSTAEEQYHRAYSIRTLERFMVRFGLAEDSGEKRVLRPTVVIGKTLLFDALVKWKGDPTVD